MALEVTRSRGSPADILIMNDKSIHEHDMYVYLHANRRVENIYILLCLYIYIYIYMFYYGLFSNNIYIYLKI